MAKTDNVATVEVDPEVQAAEARLREAEAARTEAYRVADDPGELAGWPEATWKRLPLPEPEATQIKSDAEHSVRLARWAVAKAKRPKVPLADARAALARAEAHLGAARARLAQVAADKGSDDRVTARQAVRDEKAAVDAVLDGEIVLEIAAATVRDAEAREVDHRKPLFELRAITLARQVDALLDAVVAVVSDQVALDEQARAAGCPVDAGIFVGALPERVVFWREQNARRLTRER